jgi:N-glycosylase/DNA lyase
VTLTSRTTLAVPAPFDLRIALFGHGWIDLAPHRWDHEARTWRFALAASDVAVRQDGTRLRITVADARRPAPAHLATIRAMVARMLRLDEDFTPFWRLCAREPARRWVALLGAGRLLRSPSRFEDLLKLLLTTNCSWAATKQMTARLVAALGARTPGGERSFPDAAACAGQPERFWRDVVRAGYRARACRELSIAFASDGLEEELASFADREALRARLSDLLGFGPYAVGQALRLFGHYAELALDSWCRNQFARARARRKPPSDHAIGREYRAYGDWAGLVLWTDLTAPWFAGEPPFGTSTRAGRQG